MKNFGRRLVNCLPVILVAVAAWASPLPARYSGVFDIRDVQMGDEEVTLTFVVRITNQTPAPVTDGVLRLEDPLAPPTLLGTIPGVAFEPGASVTLEGTVAIPLREYEHWMRGGLPRAFLGSGVAEQHESFASAPSESGRAPLVEIEQNSDQPTAGEPTVFERVELRLDPRAFEVAP